MLVPISKGPVDRLVGVSFANLVVGIQKFVRLVAEGLWDQSLYRLVLLLDQLYALAGVAAVAGVSLFDFLLQLSQFQLHIL